MDEKYANELADSLAHSDLRGAALAVADAVRDALGSASSASRIETLVGCWLPVLASIIESGVDLALDAARIIAHVAQGARALISPQRVSAA